MPGSLWQAVTPSADHYPAMVSSNFCDVGIVGGGFLGLSTAIALRRRGVDVSLLEAADIGWGASGRNNGLVTAGLKRDPWEVRSILGEHVGDRLISLSATAPDRLFALIEELNIECDARRSGWIQAAHSTAAVETIRRRHAVWHDLGAPVEWISAADVADRLGTARYRGAWCDRRGGSLNPLALARGLARAAVQAGARIYCDSHVEQIDRKTHRWRLETNQGSLACEQVLLCTNAYGSISPTRGTVIPVRTAQVATEPLAAGQDSRIVPGGESVSDTRRLLTSFRKTADGRLIMGGADATAGDEHDGLRRALHHAAAEMFTSVGGLRWQYFWSGYLAISRDHLPAIHDHGAGMLSAIGCNGRGIAMTTSMGRLLADLIISPQSNDCPVPVRRARKHPGFAFRRPAIATTVRLKRVLDRYGH